jgi:hypothetical protein
MAINKKVRFEVFKRDKFTCQYCGQSAPTVVLQCDHIHPKSKGGKDDILNLVTSCFDCNQGKKARLLSDDSVITKQKKQLDILQERREQLDLMLEWQKGLLAADDSDIEVIADYWQTVTKTYYLNERGIESTRKLLKRFNAAEIIEGIRASAYYLQVDHVGVYTHESINEAWSKVPGICAIKRVEVERPYMQQLFYARGILRNRLTYVNEQEVMGEMEWYVTRGVDPQTVISTAKRCSSYTNFMNRLWDYLPAEVTGQVEA